jgi:hypothetical protein
MSRTRKGTRGPGWEPWSSRHQKAMQRAAYQEPFFNELTEELNEEAAFAWYCHTFGPCHACLTRLAERGEADGD